MTVRKYTPFPFSFPSYKNATKLQIMEKNKTHREQWDAHTDPEDGATDFSETVTIYQPTRCHIP
jgi:hypothetical protein